MLEVSGDADWRWNSVLVVHRMYVVSIYYIYLTVVCGPLLE